MSMMDPDFREAFAKHAAEQRKREERDEAAAVDGIAQSISIEINHSFRALGAHVLVTGRLHAGSWRWGVTQGGASREVAFAELPAEEQKRLSAALRKMTLSIPT